MPLADIFFGSLLSFLIGVLVASAGWNFYLACALAALSGAALCYFRKIRVIFILLFLCIFFSGALYFHFYENLKKSGERFALDETISFSGRIAREPKFTEKSQYFDFELAPPEGGEITVFTARIPEYGFGDFLELRGEIEERETGRNATAFFPEVISHENGADALRGFSRVKGALIEFKRLFLGAFRRILPFDSAALLAGLTFGSRSDFTDEFKEQMAASGTTHLVALSGYNIAILVILVTKALGRFLSRRATFYATTLIIFLFVLMVGAEASVVRAAVMGFLVLFAKEAGRIYSFRNAVTLAAALMVLVNPTVLVFDIGFQLSFLSLLGIVYVAPAINSFVEKFLKRAPVRAGAPLRASSFLGWRENAVTTFAAQLMVIPVIIGYFEEFSFSALFANILILEFVPLTMIAGFIVGAVALIAEPLGIFAGWFINLLLTYEIFVIRLFSGWRLPLGGSIGSWLFAVVYYLALFGFVIYAGDRHRTRDHIK